MMRDRSDQCVYTGGEKTKKRRAGEADDNKKGLDGEVMVDMVEMVMSCEILSGRRSPRAGEERCRPSRFLN